MKLEEIEHYLEISLEDRYIDKAIVTKLLAVAKAAKDIANIEHLSLDPRFNIGPFYRALENALNELEKE